METPEKQRKFHALSALINHRRENKRGQRSRNLLTIDVSRPSRFAHSSAREMETPEKQRKFHALSALLIHRRERWRHQRIQTFHGRRADHPPRFCHHGKNDDRTNNFAHLEFSITTVFESVGNLSLCIIHRRHVHSKRFRLILQC